jgi:hypothetical protein
VFCKQFKLDLTSKRHVVKVQYQSISKTSPIYHHAHLYEIKLEAFGNHALQYVHEILIMLFTDTDPIDTAPGVQCHIDMGPGVDCTVPERVPPGFRNCWKSMINFQVYYKRAYYGNCPTTRPYHWAPPTPCTSRRLPIFTPITSSIRARSLCGGLGCGTRITLGPKS